MRVLVVSSDVPFVEGGHRIITRALLRALRDSGIEAESWFTTQNPFGRQIQAYISNRLTCLQEDGMGRKIDGIIALRYPAYCVKADRVVVWLTHRMREYYDLWDEFCSRISFAGRIKESVRKAIIHRMDRTCLKRARKIFTISNTVRDRLKIWGNFLSETLYPPPPQRNYYVNDYENYFFFPSRLSRLKRQDIAIKAMKYINGAKLVITGNGEERDRLTSIVEMEGLTDRVIFTGFLDEREMVEMYSKALGVVFIPYKEDYGFVTVEAFYSAKPVITFSDSGGPVELVRDGENGFITEPTPEALAEKMAFLVKHREKAREMGHEALKIKDWLNWSSVVEKLTEALK
ncbi:MAG: glycosyltransferase family 4 protein [Candidatus Aminicenantes bacterium]|nr:glycosyltransferase family 4 protein [Candidatus Aminicenantes bacterium]